MTTRDLTVDDFGSAIRANDVVFVRFWASWAAPSKAFAPVFAASAQTHPDLLYASVDVDAQDPLAKAAEVMSLPTVLAFKHARLVFNHAGTLSAEALERVVGQVVAFDVEGAAAP